MVAVVYSFVKLQALLLYDMSIYTHTHTHARPAHMEQEAVLKFICRKQIKSRQNTDEGEEQEGDTEGWSLKTVLYLTILNGYNH